MRIQMYLWSFEKEEDETNEIKIFNVISNFSLKSIV